MPWRWPGQPEIAGLIESNARDEILGRFAGSLPAIISEGGLQLITFANANGEVVARIHNPEKFGGRHEGPPQDGGGSLVLWQSSWPAPSRALRP
ncbi:MAG: hypothetical protein KL839_16735 [Rhizobium sp.]|nr:hypothetical protein [Rhizobium sp.]